MFIKVCCELYRVLGTVVYGFEMTCLGWGLWGLAWEAWAGGPGMGGLGQGPWARGYGPRGLGWEG